MKHFFSLTKIIAVLLVSIFLLSGCGLLFNGTKDKVNFTSEPSSSKVYVDGTFMGNTPVELVLKSNKTYIVEFKKDGYARQTYNLTNGIAAGYVILDVLGGLIPVIIDAATGAWYTLDYDHIHCNLEMQK